MLTGGDFAAVAGVADGAEAADELPDVRGEADEDGDRYAARLMEELFSGEEGVRGVVDEHLARGARVHLRIEAAGDNVAAGNAREESTVVAAQQGRDVLPGENLAYKELLRLLHVV